MSVRLMAVGDIDLRPKPEGCDPVEFVKETLGEADLLFGNLEVPLTNAREPVEEKTESLRAPVEQGSYFSATNFLVVNLANNHIGDYGAAGLTETTESLRRAGVGFVGAGRTISEAMQGAVYKVRSTEVTFIGLYDQGAVWLSEVGISADITLRDDGTVAYELLSVRIVDDYRPRPITDQNEMAEFRIYVERISAVLEQGVETWWWFGEIGGTYLAGNLKAFGIRIRRYGFGHAIEMVRWLTGRFALKCYVGMIRRRLRRRA